jgi:hypothetical protein
MKDENVPTTMLAAEPIGRAGRPEEMGTASHGFFPTLPLAEHYNRT